MRKKEIVYLATAGVILGCVSLCPASAEPLTLDRVAASVGDVAYVVFYFPEEDHRDAIESLRSYWLAEKKRKAIKEVVFLSSYDHAFGKSKETLKNRNFYIYGTFAATKDNLVFKSRSFRIIVDFN
jgi:hypothetical protein